MVKNFRSFAAFMLKSSFPFKDVTKIYILYRRKKENLHRLTLSDKHMADQDMYPETSASHSTISRITYMLY